MGKKSKSSKKSGKSGKSSKSKWGKSAKSSKSSKSKKGGKKSKKSSKSSKSSKKKGKSRRDSFEEDYRYNEKKKSKKAKKAKDRALIRKTLTDRSSSESSVRDVPYVLPEKRSRSRKKRTFGGLTDFINRYQLMFFGLVILFLAEVAFAVAASAPGLVNKKDHIKKIKKQYKTPDDCKRCYEYAELFEQDKSVQSLTFAAMAFLATTIMFAFIMMGNPSLRFCMGNFAALSTLISVAFATGALVSWVTKVREYLYRSSLEVNVVARGMVGYAYVVFIAGGLLDAIGGLCIFAAANWDVPCLCSKVPKETV